MKSNALPFVLLFCLIGCKKDAPVDHDTSILIGKHHDKMNIVMFENPIDVTWRVTSQEYKMDVNNDFEDDLKFTSSYIGSPGGIRRSMASIVVLNPDITLAVAQQSDSVYVCSQVKNDSVVSRTFYTLNSGFVCSAGNRNEFKNTVTQSYPIVYSTGDVYSSSVNWSGGNFMLSDLNSSFIAEPPYGYHNELFGPWNNRHLKYIAFRITRNNTTRLGWIQVSLENYTHIQLHGFAIEK